MLLGTLTVSAAVAVYVMLRTGCVFKHTGMKVAPSKLMIRGLQARWMDFKGRLGWFFGRYMWQTGWLLVPRCSSPSESRTAAWQTHGHSQTWNQKDRQCAGKTCRQKWLWPEIRAEKYRVSPSINSQIYRFKSFFFWQFLPVIKNFCILVYLS